MECDPAVTLTLGNFLDFLQETFAASETIVPAIRD